MVNKPSPRTDIATLPGPFPLPAKGILSYFKLPRVREIMAVINALLRFRVEPPLKLIKTMGGYYLSLDMEQVADDIDPGTNPLSGLVRQNFLVVDTSDHQSVTLNANTTWLVAQGTNLANQISISQISGGTDGRVLFFTWQISNNGVGDQQFGHLITNSGADATKKMNIQAYRTDVVDIVIGGTYMIYDADVDQWILMNIL